MLQGMTAHYLTHSTYALKSGRYLPGSRAAGRRRRLGDPDAKDAGRARCSAPFPQQRKPACARGRRGRSHLYTERDFEAEVKRFTSGRGVDVVYDSVGKTTFEKSLNCLRPRGLAGALRTIQRTGSALRPHHSQRQRVALPHAPQPGALRAHARRTALARGRRAELVASGKLKLRIDRTYPLAESGRGHRDLEAARPPGNWCCLSRSAVVGHALACPEPADPFDRRRQAVASGLAERKLDALLVAFSPNLRYLTGFTGSNGGLLVPGGKLHPLHRPALPDTGRSGGRVPGEDRQGPLLTEVARRHRQAGAETHRVRARPHDLRCLRVAEVLDSRCGPRSNR